MNAITASFEQPSEKMNRIMAAYSLLSMLALDTVAVSCCMGCVP